MKKLVSLVFASLLLIGAFASCTNNAAPDSPQTSNQSESPVTPKSKPTGTTTPQTSAAPAPEQSKEYTFGDTFTFDNLEVTIGTELYWSSVQNRFSDLNGAEVLELPITVKNLGSETHQLNPFYITMFGSKGTELDSVSTYFDNDVLSAGDMRTGAQTDTFLHIVYDGDGDYFLEFDNYSEQIDVKLSVQK